MKILVFAPHPDDEVLGVGGTLLREKANGSEIGWVIATNMKTEDGWSADQIRNRANEVNQVKIFFSFNETFELNFSATKLDQIPKFDLIAAVSGVIKSFKPEKIFVPHKSDIHSDHRALFDAVISSSKWFRHPYIKTILAYETLSETDFNVDLNNSFRPNVFVNIEPYLMDKLKAISIYSSEIGDHPFPRSFKSIEALATLRGSAAGFKAAEAFELLRERV
jgi:LmbE family N-acetylglucosaminyl deacetylase